MCVLLISSLRRIVRQSGAQPGGIVRHGALTQGFQTLCGVLKTAMIIIFFGLPTLSAVKAQNLRPHEMVISDPWSGAAISGYDPVAFFVEQDAKAGKPDFSLVHQGTVWHFANEGNRAAFREQPDAYVPAFGGYDPVALASGLIVAGTPRFFLVHEGRLYLFRRAENRAAFAAKPQLAADAQNLWPELSRQLSP
ncbi:MAG: YHS domain-containing (seleno)protein [Rhabdaerophilum sp.]